MKLLLWLRNIPWLRGLIHKLFFRGDRIKIVLEQEYKELLKQDLPNAAESAFIWGKDVFEDEAVKVQEVVKEKVDSLEKAADEASDQLVAEIKKARKKRSTKKKEEN